MNKPRAGAADFARALAGRFPDAGCDIALFPPFTAMDEVSSGAGGRIMLGAQNVFYEESGPYTGEVSCGMLKDAGCGMVIVGHSERRRIFGESDETVAAKTKAVADCGMRVLLCVGETAEQRADGGAAAVVRRQIEAAVRNISPRSITVAYEPVWAIGTGNSARISDIEEMHEGIRGVLSALYGADAEGVGVVYGGSVNARNARDIAGAANVDGMLVGGASLELETFAVIIEAILAV